MSRSCLFEVQPTGYATVYVLHFIGLGWMGAMWIADGVQIPWWVAQASRGERLRVLGSARPLAGATYPGILALAVALVTLTWTCAVDWSTDNLRPLLGVLLAEIGAVLLLATCVLHRGRLLGSGASARPVDPGRSWV